SLALPTQLPGTPLRTRRGHHVHPFDLTGTVRQPLDTAATHRFAVAIPHQKGATRRPEFGHARLRHVRRIEIKALVQLAHLVDHRPDQRGPVPRVDEHMPKIHRSNVQLSSHDYTSTPRPPQASM